jgi:peptidoglycan hydrolase-like protein with peptidoglycan-binding domain
VRAAQAALLYLGYAPGKIDGVIGPRTQNALTSFRIAHGLQPSTALDSETMARLQMEVGW